MLEKEIEQYLRKEIKKHKGMALKFVTPGFSGVMDRIILMPEGKIFFAEIKAPGKKLRSRQVYVKELFENLGLKIYKIDSKEQAKKLIDEVFTT